MKHRIWIILGLLLLAGGWLFWPSGHHRIAPAPRATAPRPAPAAPAAVVTRPASTAPVLFGNQAAGTNAAVAVTNRFAYRLHNTSKTLGQLQNDPRAVLLENAFIETGVPLNLSIPKHLKAAGDPGAYIVQADRPLDNAFRAMIAAAGGQIVSYIPNNAYLVTASSVSAAAMAGQAGVAAVLPYEPYYKISASLIGLAVQQTNLPAGTALTLGLFPNDSQQTIRQIQRLGGSVVATDRSPFGPIVRVVPPADWTALAALPGVQIVEPSRQRVSANDLARVTLGISTDTVTNYDYMNLSGANVMVEMNDSGVDRTHPDFSVTGSAESPGTVPPSRIFGDSPLSLVDTNGHGTHVAGIIAGNGSESYTLNPNEPQGSVTNADFRGKAPAANLFSVAFLDANGNSLPIPDSYLQAAPALTNALISNNSWVYTGDNTYDLAAASYDAAVRDALPQITGSQPVLFVFAAGNDGGGTDDGIGGNPDTILSPATAKDVVTVGALEQLRNITNLVADSSGNTNPVWQLATDSSDQVAGYSARGNVGIGTEGDSGRFKPDVVAPGSFVVSTRSSEWDQNAYYNPTNYSYSEYAFQIVEPGTLNYYTISIPANAVGVNIYIVTNLLSPSPFPPDMPIYASSTAFPDPTVPGTVDFFTTNNQVNIPPDGGSGYINSIQGVGLNFAVGDSINVPVNYDLIMEIAITNGAGDYFTVLSNLNESIGPWYRYESGTSMAAPAVSGTLALMQDYFTNDLHSAPSPALLKAMLINGSRSQGSYSFSVTNTINLQGWGLPNLPAVIPTGLTNQLNVPCSEVFIDQSPTNALATGDSQTYMVASTNFFTAFFPLRVTLAWTDPAGNPAAAIKLVNSLELVVTNLDTGDVYFGNDMDNGSPSYSQAWDTNTTPFIDNINNVENVFLQFADASSYSVTVIGRSVNVNAVTAQTNNVVQDYALVISCGEGEVTNAITVTANAPVSNPTSDQNVLQVGVNANGMATNSDAIGGVFFNQLAGANTPLLGTNIVGAISNYAGNAVVTIGMTNQWHFYVVQNTTGFTNAAFVTFNPNTLSVPRMGVYSSTLANSTQPEADIDLYVATGAGAAGLTNLDPAVVSNCVNGVNGNASSLSRGGTEFVAFTNSAPGQTYYIGVKSETSEAGEYGFLPVFSQQPFSTTDTNGVETVNGLLLPVRIPDGSPAYPGIGFVFALAVQPIEVQNVIVSNTIAHQNFGDLIGAVKHNRSSVVLNNHDSYYNPSGIYSLTYDSSLFPVPGSQPPDGPGTLQVYQGQQGIGPWILTEVDDALTHTGAVTGFTLRISPHQNLNQGVTVSLQPGGYFFGYIDIPVGATNLTLSATNISAITPGSTFDPLAPGVLYEKLGELPAPPPTPLTNYDQSVWLTNPPAITPGASIIVDRSSLPPIQAGRYFVTLWNNSTRYIQTFYIIAAYGVGAVQPVDFNSSGPVPILDDAVSYAYITNAYTPGGTNEIISQANVGLCVQHERISDMVFTLISPDGTRYLLMENRGGTSTNGAGATVLTTNIVNIASSGSSQPDTNFIPVGVGAGTLLINYNFFTVPDQMTVYDGTNNFSSPVRDTGMTSGTGQLSIPFPAGTDYLTIIMNQYTNGAGPGQDLWTYTAGGVQSNILYLTFTENTNITTTPIKFAPTPLAPNISASNVWADSFEAYAPGIYTAPNPIGGGWTVLTNQVEIVTTPPAADGTNLLQMDNGAVAVTLPTVAGQQYLLTYDLGSLLSEGGGAPTNANWTPQSVLFTAQQNNESLVLDASGGGLTVPNTETLTFGPNALLDNFTLSSVPANLYYLPEVDMSGLVGTSGYGVWTLEMLDDRAGATNVAPALLGWQMQFVFSDTIPAPAVITPGSEICNPVPAGDTLWYQVNVPLNAFNVTNTLVSSDQPVNLLFNQISPDTNGSVALLTTSTNGVNTLGTNSAPVLVPGSSYYLGVQNPNGVPVQDACVEVDFNLLTRAYAYTEPAQLVTGTGAQLNGFATPNGYPSMAWFEWGTNTAYGNTTTPVPVGSGYSVVYVTNSIVNLVTNVPYHFRLVVSNALGVVDGFDQILDEANVVAWGANYAGQLIVPTNRNVTAIAAAYDHNLALTTNGQVLAWGDNTFGQAAVPPGLSNAVAVAVGGGEYYSLALLNNGTVSSWGANFFTETNVPAGLSNVVVVSGGQFTSMALQNSGSIVAWGAEAIFPLLTNIPSAASNIVAVAGGGYHSLALRNDGTVLAWGYDNATNVPAGLNNVAAIAAGRFHSLALKYDGTVTAWGDDSDGQTNVPPGLSNVVAIAAGGYQNLALKADGTLVTWGDNSAGQSSVPVGLTNVVAIAAGYFHSLVLTPQSLTNNSVLALVPGEPQTNNIPGNSITYYQVNVPLNADFATNTLLFATNGVLNIWFSTNTPASLNTTNATLLGGNTNSGAWILSATNGVPLLVPGSTYYLGVQNPNSVTVNYAIQVTFHLLTAPVAPPVTISSIAQTTNGFLLTWYAPSNELFLVQWSSNLPPVWQSFTNIVSYNTNYPASATNATFTFLDTGGFTPMRFYQVVLLGSLSALTNGAPLTVTVPARSTAYYTVTAPANADAGTNALLSASAPVNLLFNQNFPPTGTGAGDYTLQTNSTGGASLLTAATTPPLVPGATYYLAVQNTNAFAVTFNLQVGFHVQSYPLVYPTSSVTYSNGSFVLNWLAPTNDIFEVQVATNIASPINWLTLATGITYSGPVTPANGLFTYVDDPATSAVPFNTPFRFYQVLLTGQAAPAISGFTFNGSGLTLTWSAPTNDQFQVVWTTNIAPPQAWTPFPGIITSTNGAFSFTDTNAPLLMKFYELILLP